MVGCQCGYLTVLNEMDSIAQGLPAGPFEVGNPLKDNVMHGNRSGGVRKLQYTCGIAAISLQARLLAVECTPNHHMLTVRGFHFRKVHEAVLLTVMIPM